MYLCIRRLVVVCVLALQSCTELPSATPPAAGDTWVILSPSAPDVPPGAWRPTPEQVLAARDAARRRIKADLKTLRPVGAMGEWGLFSARAILRSWQSYRLQAYGTTHGHKRVIRLNFITPRTTDDGGWRENALMLVCDGGPSYWQADYDPATGTILWWQANGVA